jgi:SM-20-related protein
LDPLTDFECDRIAGALADSGLIVLEQMLPAPLRAGLASRIQALAPELRRAGIGRNRGHRLSDAVRTDRTAWLNPDDPAEAAYLAWMESLRQGLNQRLFLGLFDYEAHFAVYEPGAYYRRHLDAFQGSRNRVVTTVCYLNTDWEADDGGELLIYPTEGERPLQTVMPRPGTLAVFLSDRFPHEVLPARRQRYSIAGWFRLKGGGSDRADPPR